MFLRWLRTYYVQNCLSSPVHTSHNVEATLSNTRPTCRTMQNRQSWMPFLATMSNEIPSFRQSGNKLNYTGCSLSGDSLLGSRRAFSTGVLDRWHKCLVIYWRTTCIRWCLVSRVCDWVMTALSALLLIFSFQFNLIFFDISKTRIPISYPLAFLRDHTLYV